MQEMPKPYQDTEQNIGTSDTLPSEQHSLSEAHVGGPDTDKVKTPRLEIAQGAGRIIPSTEEIMKAQDKAAAENFVRANEKYLRESGFDFDKWNAMMKGESPAESRPEPTESGIISSLRRGIDRISGVFTKKSSDPSPEVISRSSENPISPRVRETLEEVRQRISNEGDRQTFERILKEIEASESGKIPSTKTEAA